MRLDLAIGRLVLHGAPLGRRGEAALRAALGAELARLVRRDAAPRPAPPGSPAWMGRRIAAAVHARLGEGAAWPEG